MKNKKIKHYDTYLNIKIDSDLLKRFNNYCEKNKLKKSKVIRELMREYLEKGDENES